MKFALDVLPAAIADIVEAARWYGDQREGLVLPPTSDLWPLASRIDVLRQATLY
jgi:hypothetical protein